MKPLILDFITERKSDNNVINYVYDHKLSLNVITIDNIKIPFVDLNSEIVNILTQTRAQIEGTDDGIDFVKRKTITKERGEFVNDFNFSLMEFKTKTFADKERDDESTINLQ